MVDLVALLFRRERKRKMIRLMFILIIGSWALGPENQAVADALTADDLFKIMLAARERITSLDVRLEQKGYYPTEEKTENPVLMYKLQMEYRKKGPHWYCQIVNQTYDSSGKPDRNFTEAAFFSSDRTCFYREVPSGSSEREGRIAPGEVEFSGWMSATPDFALWHAPLEFWEEWRKQSAGRSSIVYNETNRIYILEFPYTENESPLFRYTIEPSKGYIPVIREWLGSQKEIIQRDECSDFRLVDGFWIPFRHRVYLSNGTLGTETVFQSVSVNAPIAKEKLFFEYPEGTIVEDQVLGVRYIKGREIEKGAIEKTENLSIQGELPPSATDEQLAQAAVKAEILLERQPEDSSKKLLALYPDYVWIEPGRKEYSLMIGEEKAERPALTNYRFEGGGLVLHDLKDQISASGQIRLTIERPAGMTGYREGTLDLDFAGQKKTIHLISPPILE